MEDNSLKPASGTTTGNSSSPPLSALPSSTLSRLLDGLTATGLMAFGTQVYALKTVLPVWGEAAKMSLQGTQWHSLAIVSLVLAAIVAPLSVKEGFKAVASKLPGKG